MIDIKPWGDTTSFADFVKTFKCECGEKLIHWEVSYGVATIPEEFLTKILEAAMPYKAVASTDDYGVYDDMDAWCEEHCTGMVTHSNITYMFEVEDDAIQFKLRWG